MGKLNEISQNLTKLLDLIKETSADRAHEDIIKEIFEGQKTLFNYDFNIFNYINQKISNLLTFILITQGVIALLISGIIRWQQVSFQTLVLILPLLFSGICLTKSGLIIVRIMKPREIHLPEFASEPKVNKGEYYQSECQKIINARLANEDLLKETAEKFDYINRLIILSIIAFLITSVLSLIIFLEPLFSN